MSWDEIIGLTITAALIGGAVGAALAALAWRCGVALVERREHTRQAFARWLAARLTFSRASASFVAAFRTLAAERRDSPQFRLRMEEAQRARVSWSEALRGLDLAKAMLLTSVHDPAIDRRLGEYEPDLGESLRDAVAGDSKGVEKWLYELRAADQRALDFVRGATASTQGKQSIRCKRWAHLTTPIRNIVDRWSRG